MSTETLVHITAPHFCAGVVADESDTIRTAAPILRYMTGWKIDRVLAYARSRGWSVTSATAKNGPAPFSAT